MAKQSTPIAGRLITLCKNNFDNSHVMCNDWDDFLDKLVIPDDPDVILDDMVNISVVRCHYEINSTQAKSCEVTPLTLKEGT